LPNVVYEVTSKTFLDSYALRPCWESTERILGVVGRGLHLYPAVALHALNPVSNHCTELLSSRLPSQIPRFIGFVKTNISKEIRDLHKLPYSVFTKKRASVIMVGPHIEDEEYRLSYVLSQGTKENLVASPRDWPGVTGVKAMEGETELFGWWFDRSAEARARARGETFDRYRYATRYPVPFSPLPSWTDKGPEKYQQRVTEIVDEIVEARARKKLPDPLGAERLMAYSPRYIPDDVERSPAPLVLSTCPRRFEALRRVINRFCQEFHEQSEQQREAPDTVVEFPPFSFPPGRPMTPGPSAENFSLAQELALFESDFDEDDFEEPD
jgi:hypothetical protein